MHDVAWVVAISMVLAFGVLRMGRGGRRAKVAFQSASGARATPPRWAVTRRSPIQSVDRQAVSGRLGSAARASRKSRTRDVTPVRPVRPPIRFDAARSGQQRMGIVAFSDAEGGAAAAARLCRATPRLHPIRTDGLDGAAFELDDGPKRLSMARQFQMIAERIASAIAAARRAETLHRSAGRQLDAVDYALLNLRAELEGVILLTKAGAGRPAAACNLGTRGRTDGFCASKPSLGPVDRVRWRWSETEAVPVRSRRRQTGRSEAAAA